MRLNDAINIEDLHKMAKRRLPKIAFDFIEGGLEDERGLETNTSAFHKHQLLPRYLVDVSVRNQSRTLFGHSYASPFGISPTGGAGLFRRGADLMLAEAAAKMNIPYIMSDSRYPPPRSPDTGRLQGSPMRPDVLGAGNALYPSLLIQRAVAVDMICRGSPLRCRAWRLPGAVVPSVTCRR